MSVIVLDKQNFEDEVLRFEGIVLVDFYADWCGPCKTMSTIIEELAQSYCDRVKLTKLNIDNAQEIATQYAVTSIPTFILFKEGKKLDQMVGAFPRSQMEDFINKSL